MQPFCARKVFHRSIALLALLAAFFGALGGAMAHAELMQTSPGVFQSTNSKVKVIASSSGLFIVSLKTGIPIQQFNIEKLPREEAAHAFIRFAPEKGRNPYSEIVIANSHYPITGNLTLRVGDVTVSVDNSNPYATVKYNDGSPEGEHLLGFYGTTKVIDGKGPLATVLTANQLNKEYRKVIQPYTAVDTTLQFNGKPVEAQTVGVLMDRNHVCLADKAKVLTLEQLKAIQAGKSEAQQAQMLEKSFSANKRDNPLRGLLILRGDGKEPMVALHTGRREVYDFRPVTNSLSRHQTVCVLSPMG
jgi:hypothetical protein